MTNRINLETYKLNETYLTNLAYFVLDCAASSIESQLALNGIGLHDLWRVDAEGDDIALIPHYDSFKPLFDQVGCSQDPHTRAFSNKFGCFESLISINSLVERYDFFDGAQMSDDFEPGEEIDEDELSSYHQITRGHQFIAWIANNNNDGTKDVFYIDMKYPRDSVFEIVNNLRFYYKPNATDENIKQLIKDKAGKLLTYDLNEDLDVVGRMVTELRKHLSDDEVTDLTAKVFKKSFYTPGEYSSHTKGLMALMDAASKIDVQQLLDNADSVTGIQYFMDPLDFINSHVILKTTDGNEVFVYGDKTVCLNEQGINRPEKSRDAIQDLDVLPEFLFIAVRAHAQETGQVTGKYQKSSPAATQAPQTKFQAG